ncbi:MAG TPA: MoaD/ThiS family protein [Stellaceae bacterium]|nr:MoaD/ThiS family protein [Stellaceae bacterium]
MPRVRISGTGARRFTGGLTEFDVEADTVRRMILELDRRFPGIGKQIDESMAVAIDGQIFQDAYQARLAPDSEVYLIPKIGGG